MKMKRPFVCATVSDEKTHPFPCWEVSGCFRPQSWLWAEAAPLPLFPTGGPSPPVALDCTVPGAVQRQFEAPSSFSVWRCPREALLGTGGHEKGSTGFRWPMCRLSPLMFQWQDGGGLGQKINWSHRLVYVPPLLALLTARFFSRATPCTGFLAQSGPEGRGMETLPHLCHTQDGSRGVWCEMKLCSAFMWCYSWAHPTRFGQPWELIEPIGLHLVRGPLLKGWKRGFLIAKPLESIESSACYSVWSPWTVYERWRQLRPRFTTLASINSYQLLKSQKVWLSLCCVKLVFLAMQPIVLNERT